MQKQDKDSMKKATLTTLAGLAMIHCFALVAVNVGAQVSTQEAFVAYMSPGVVSRVSICDKQSAL